MLDQLFVCVAVKQTQAVLLKLNMLPNSSTLFRYVNHFMHLFSSPTGLSFSVAPHGGENIWLVAEIADSNETIWLVVCVLARQQAGFSASYQEVTLGAAACTLSPPFNSFSPLPILLAY